MDPMLKRVLKKKVTQLQQSTTNLMKQDIGGYPSFNIDQKTINFWGPIAFEILKEGGDNNNGSSFRKKSSQRVQINHSFSSSQIFSSDEDKSLEIPQFVNIAKTVVIIKARMSFRKQKKFNKKANKNPQQWNVEYHQSLKNYPGVRNATVYARNKDEEVWNVGTHSGFRRKSCKLDEDQLPNKQQRFSNIKVEIQMHKKKRIANLLVQTLKKQRKGSTFGKHQNILSVAKWAIHTKAHPYKILLSPSFKRSTSNEFDECLISNEILEQGQRSQRKFKTIQQPEKMKSFKFLNIAVDEGKDILITPRRSPAKKLKINQARVQIQQSKLKYNGMSDMSSVNIGNRKQITPIKIENCYSTHKKNQSTTNQVSTGQSKRSILPPLKQRDSLFQSLKLMTEQKTQSKILPQGSLLRNKKKSVGYLNMVTTFNSPTIFDMHRKNMSIQVCKN